MLKARNTIREVNHTRPNLYVVNKEKSEAPASVKKRKAPSPLRIVLGVLGLYMLFSFGTAGYQVWQLNQDLDVLEVDQKTLLEEQKALKNEVEALYKPEMIEKIARESLGLVNPGETKLLPAIPDKNIPKPGNVDVNDIRD